MSPTYFRNSEFNQTFCSAQNRPEICLDALAEQASRAEVEHLNGEAGVNFWGKSFIFEHLKVLT